MFSSVRIFEEKKASPPLHLILGEIRESGSNAAQKFLREERMSSAGSDREVPV